MHVECVVPIDKNYYVTGLLMFYWFYCKTVMHNKSLSIKDNRNTYKWKVKIQPGWSMISGYILIRVFNANVFYSEVSIPCLFL